MSAQIAVLLAALALPGPLTTASAEAFQKPPIVNACAGDQTNVAYWTKVLKAPDPQRRVQAATNLGEARSEGAVPALIDALKDESLAVRLAAIRALGRIGREAKAAISALTAGLNDKDPIIRSEAARALAKIREPR